MSDPINAEQERRHSDVMIAALTQRFNDFIERYDRDIGASAEWRRTAEITLKEQSIILAEISPAYTRGKWVVTLIMIGSVGMAVKEFWTHISFK